MIFVIDDDEIMAECISRWVDSDVKIFSNAIEAMEAISDGAIPKLIFLDILLDGPDGFSFLNELVSYDDTARIPVVVVTSLNLEKQNLSEYIEGYLDYFMDNIADKIVNDYEKSSYDVSKELISEELNYFNQERQMEFLNDEDDTYKNQITDILDGLKTEAEDKKMKF